MAGDWIKMRTDLYRDPKVCVIADLLLDEKSELARYVNQNMQCDMAITRNVMRNVTVGALVSVWGVLRHRGKRNDSDLVVKNCTILIIDDVADIPGFGTAMEAVGWVEQYEDSVVLPRFFEEFNVDPAEEAKAKNAERQRRYREKLKAESYVTQDVTVASQNNAREEKRRVNKTPISPTGFDEFWLAYPKKVGKGQAIKTWAKINPPIAEILKSLAWQKTSEQWMKDAGQFIPNPSTYLNQQRWLDEPAGMQSVDPWEGAIRG